PLRLAVDDGSLPVPDDDLGADMYDLATEILGNAGYDQYEISNWSKPGFQAQHNLQYWYNLPYLGLGPGAHGYAGGIRYSVTTLPQRYIDALSQPDELYDFPRSPATAKVTPIDREAEMSDTIMMNLRLLQHGIRRADFKARFGEDIVELKRDALQKFVDYGVLHVDDEVVRLTDAGRFVSNSILSELV
ncbi:MAG: coproporphyrinogen III oxidase, partial [Aggregatilineales bacterium]